VELPSTEPIYIRSSLKAQTGTMGIKNLFQIISENAPDAIKTGEIKNQFGRKVAIDA